MAYCQYCGTKNDKDAEICKMCGEKLYRDKPSTSAVQKEIRTKRDQECFGLPRFGAMVGIAIGLLVILFGAGVILSRYYQTRIEIWPLAVVIFGLMVVSVALSALRRDR